MSTSVGDFRSQESFWQDWASTAARDQRGLRLGMTRLVNRIHEAAVHDDFQIMQECRTLYNLGASYCMDEPYLTDYEYGLASIGVIFADNYFYERKYQLALQELSAVLDLLSAGDARRQELGLPAVTNYRPRVHMLTVLGYVKWFGSPQYAEELLSTQEYLELTSEISGVVLSELRHGKLKDREDRRNIEDSIAILDLKACKVAFRHLPDSAPATIARFNAHHGDQLTPVVGHFRVCTELDHCTSHFWDFELAKLYLSGQHTPEEVHLCTEMRAAMARETFGNWDLGGLYRMWRREALDMLRTTGATCN